MDIKKSLSTSDLSEAQQDETNKNLIVYRTMWYRMHDMAEQGEKFTMADQDENIKNSFEILRKVNNCSCFSHSIRIVSAMLLYRDTLVGLGYISNAILFMNHFHNEVNFKLKKPLFVIGKTGNRGKIEYVQSGHKVVAELNHDFDELAKVFIPIARKNAELSHILLNMLADMPEIVRRCGKNRDTAKLDIKNMVFLKHSELESMEVLMNFIVQKLIYFGYMTTKSTTFDHERFKNIPKSDSIINIFEITVNPLFTQSARDAVSSVRIVAEFLVEYIYWSFYG